MAEYIEREAAIKCCTFGRTSLGLVNELRRLPAADVAPVRHGRWDVYSAKHGLYSCSECHCVPAFLHSPYCPNCGAKMDKEDTNGKTVD